MFYPADGKNIHTSKNSFNKWTKISSLEFIIFELKNDGKKWSRIYFEINDDFKTRDFSPLIKRVLAGVRCLYILFEGPFHLFS